MSIRNATLGLMAALLLAGVPMPAVAQTDERGDKTPEELAIEGIDRLMRALELMIQSIPQFEAPIINENGDIIIRRRHPEPKPAPDEAPAPAPPGGIST